ncbi:MAG: DUF814 domain-containing protein [Candidatus Aenigmarchaeota archaeon]|nr:DUF814 domain-containing protein [Candidatus Aenigmarchaeota archaeon]
MIEIKIQEMKSLVKSLSKLINGKIQKIKQISDNAFLFEIYLNKNKNYLVITPQIVFLTEKHYNSIQAKQFCNVLKKYLINQKIYDIRQYNSDRIIEMHTNDYILYLELFRTGNIILTDKSNKIINALIRRSWKDRVIKPNFEYKYPPSCDIEIKQQDIENINQVLEKRFEKYLLEKNKKDDKLERIRKAQKKKLEELKEKIEIYKNYAEKIYENYDKFEIEFNKIKNRSKKTMILGIPIDPKKNLKQNAAYYFDQVKKIKQKIERLKKAMEIPLKIKKTKERKEKKQSIKEWYENFRWFISSDGFLIVAGKDAKSNEKLIKKHMKKNDLVFHADITGSPFVLIKNPENKKIPERTIKQAAEFCGSYSKAWKIGISAVDVYYIKPEQVKKQGGLPLGSFIIIGKREWIRRIPVRIALGIRKNEIIYGPLDYIKEKTNNYVIIVPGNLDIIQLQKQIKFEISTQDLQKIIPYSKGEII